MAPRAATERLKLSYIRETTNRGGNPTGAIHRRRKSAMVALLATFEEQIEPLIPPGNQEAIINFKDICRRKINSLAYEGLRAVQAQPGESVSVATADLAERLAFDPEEN